MEFVYEALPGRVVFGAGTLAKIPEEAGRLGMERALIVSTPSQQAAAGRAAQALGTRLAGTTDQVAMHVPIEVARRGCALADRLDADGLIALGGGTAIGLAKAIALEQGVPILAAPSTFSGSEMTDVVGITEDGVKRTRKDRRILPKTVIYDPDLVRSLPPGIAGPSGINAMAHAVEALWAEQANPFTSVMAEEAIRRLGRALPRIAAAPEDQGARAEALLGAWLAGACLGSVGMAIHHKLAHVLGGSFDLPHAQTHTILLPYTTAYNRLAAPDAQAAVARALDHRDAPGALYELIRAIGALGALRDLGLEETALERAVDIALERPFYNPAPITRDGLHRLLEDAFHGRPPA